MSWFRSQSMRGTPYGASELRAFYPGNLARGLAASTLLILIVLGWFWLSGGRDERATITRERLADLDTVPRITLLGTVKLQRSGGGGAPNTPAPPGLSQRGHPDATPDRTHNRPDPTRSVTSRTPSNPRPVERPVQRNTAGNTRDTSADRGVTGTPGQAVDGKGTTAASGAGGPGVGNSAGLPGIEARGWLRPPQRVYPTESGATGKVTLRFTVMPNGDVVGIRPLKSADPALTQAAIRNLQRAQMRPLPRNAPQIAQQGTQTFTFVTQ